MDSVTQIALGAAVGEAMLGRKVGHRAILWGAIAGTLPDLDVFIPLSDAVKDFTYHRSASHSLFVLAILTPLMVWLINRIHPQFRDIKNRWALTIYMVFATHVLLDSFTTYGTQIFWPIVTTPVSWSSIFIIDPLYTLPILMGVIGALVLSRNSNRGHRLNQAGLILSTLYLSWTVLAKYIVEDNIVDSLAKQGITYNKLHSVPTPFNSLLWRAVVRDDNGYYVGYHSLLDNSDTITFKYLQSDEHLLNELANNWHVERLKWFSRGFYAVRQRDKDVIISDLRMGVEPDYVFQFKVAEISNPHPKATKPVRVRGGWQPDFLSRVWQRIWDKSIQL